MMKKGGFFGGFWKPKNPHSLEHLKRVMNERNFLYFSNHATLDDV
uniref:Uncharacterized protein n=1 Tax=Lepeophtheirus salmonis TaxID=72036 RepID=A0A0K2UWH6_LEPSM